MILEMDLEMDLGMDIDMDMEMDLGMDMDMEMEMEMDLGMDMDMGMDLGMDMEMEMGMDLGMDMDMEMEMDLGMDLDLDLDLDLDMEMDMEMDRKNKYRRIEIESKWFRLNKNGKQGAELTRCSNTMTESEFLSWILSGLRSRTRMWKPANDAWKLNTRPNTSGKGKHRIEHQCVKCLQWLPKKTKKIKLGIELDHITPIGGLNSLDKLKQWVERAFIEVEGYQKLCTICHAEKTRREKRENLI